MLNYIRKRDIDVILMYDLTRLYRPPSGKVADALNLLREIIEEYSVLIDFAREPAIEDPLLAELWRFFKSWVSAYERLQISLSTKYGMLKVKREGRLYYKPSIVRYYAAWLFEKNVGDVTVEEYENAEKQLYQIIRKYWDNPMYKRTLIGEILTKNKLRERCISDFPMLQEITLLCIDL